VLCSRNSISSSLVFGMTSTKPVAELAAAPDGDFLQVVDGHGRIGFSRAVGVAHPQSIRNFHAAFGGPPPPPLEHDGIDDAFTEKASIVRYWYAGRWLELTGAD
jgi:hypothetical protein